MENIFIVILTSSITAAVLTKAADYFLSSENFKKDYYKRIIELRLDAYASLDGLLSDLVGDIVSTNGKYKAVFSSNHNYSNFILRLQKAANSRIWFNKETANKVCKFMELIGWAHEENKILVTSNNEDYMNMGIRIHEKVDVIKKEIEKSLAHDLQELYKIKKFLKSM